jgi:hypothetical protein
MKTMKYERVDKPGTVDFCSMEFNKDATVTLDFGKKDGGKLKLPTDFLADAIEHYITHIITLDLKEMPCPSKKVHRKRR